MIKIENTLVSGWSAAIRGMRNPMNSWERSDSSWFYEDGWERIHIGPNDYALMMKLAKAGSEHAKFRRMIAVWFDCTAPLYFWKEHETYKVGTVSNSCSTMHKIHAKPIELSDFSVDSFDYPDDYGITLNDCMINVIADCEQLRKLYITTGEKKYWRGLVQLLPSSYNQRRTIMLNYETLANIYRQRKNHKLDEWREFCKWIKTLPYSEIITLEDNSDE